jgi:hypothetical protein
MNGGGKSGLRRVLDRTADLEGPVGYRASLLLNSISPSAAPLRLLNAAYGDQSVIVHENAVELTILAGIVPFTCSLASPEDQDVGLFERQASGHTQMLMQFRYTAASPVVTSRIRGSGAE